jgi:hypothetical protein
MALIYALLILSAAIIMTVTVILFFFVKSKENRYEEDIIFIEMAIHNWIINDNNYRILTRMFEDIWRNNCNKQRTIKAYSRFKRKYKEFYPEYHLKELVNQN